MMIDWHLPINENQNDHPDSDSRIIQALETLVAASTPEALQDVIEEWRETLFSDDTLITLCLTIIQESMRSNTEASQDLQVYLWLLEYARTDGITEACQRLTEMNEGTAIPPARVIELLSK